MFYVPLRVQTRKDNSQANWREPDVEELSMIGNVLYHHTLLHCQRNHFTIISHTPGYQGERAI